MLVKRKEENIIFVHMPKTAGTSIESALGANVDATMSEETSKIKLFTKYRHKNLSHIINSENGKPEDYFKFTVVRNTYDRFWSSYLHHIKPDGGVKMSFEEYVRHLKNYHTNPQEYTFNDSKNTGEEEYKPWLYMNNVRISHIQHFVKLDYWFSDLGELDYIMRYENLNESWSHLKNKFSLGDLPHKGPNVLKYRQDRDGRLLLRGNGTENYRTKYTAELKSIIQEIHGDEIDQLQYKF